MSATRCKSGATLRVSTVAQRVRVARGSAAGGDFGREELLGSRLVELILPIFAHLLWRGICDMPLSDRGGDCTAAGIKGAASRKHPGTAMRTVHDLRWPSCMCKSHRLRLPPWPIRAAPEGLFSNARRSFHHMCGEIVLLLS